MSKPAPNGPPAVHPGPGGPGGPSQLRHGSYGFWAPEVRAQRRVYLKAVIMTVVLTIIVMWICLPVYWGSLAHQRSYGKNLNCFFINRDGSDIGNAMQQAIEANAAAHTQNKLGWQVVDPSKYPTDQSVIDAVNDWKAWLAIVVEANSTTNLNAARLTGNSTYNGTYVMSIYYEQGRNENAAGNFLVPITQSILMPAIANFSTMSAKQFLGSYASNSTVMANVAKAPQTLANPVAYQMINMHPFSAPVATAMLLVGSIYIIIFAFIVTATGYAVRAPLEPFLKTRSLVGLRVLAPLALYVPLSFFYSMISLAFKAPFQAKYNHAAGFFLYWVFVYFTMAALGMATEFMIQILTPKFMTFFLLPLIISNVSVAQLPIQLEPWFYKYGYAVPVYNTAIATRTILFGTKSHLGLNIGVLLAWVFISFCTITAVTLFSRRRAARRKVANPEAPLPQQRPSSSSMTEVGSTSGVHPNANGSNSEKTVNGHEHGPANAGEVEMVGGAKERPY